MMSPIGLWTTALNLQVCHLGFLDHTWSCENILIGHKCGLKLEVLLPDNLPEKPAFLQQNQLNKCKCYQAFESADSSQNVQQSESNLVVLAQFKTIYIPWFVEY